MRVETSDPRFAGSAEGVLVVTKGSQGIEFGEIGDKLVTDTVELGAVAGSGLAVSYGVGGPAVLEGSVLSFTGPGTVTVTASQPGDANWEAAEDVVRAFEVHKGAATVTLGGLAQAYDGTAREVSVETVPEGLDVFVTYEGSNLAPTNAGSYGVVATVVDGQWEGSGTGTLVIAKGSQRIEFEEIGECGVAERLELRAEADSGLDVMFAVLSGPAILEGGSWLRFVETGTVVVAAMQFGDANWEAAETVRQEFTVVKSAAVVTLGGLEQVYDGEAKRVAVETVPEGLAVAVTYDGERTIPTGVGSYAVVATVADDKWTGSAEGTLVVTAADIGEREEGEFAVVLGAHPKYDGREKTVEVVSATWKGLPVTFEVAGNTAVDAGRYVLTVTGTGNFAGTRTAEWEVLRREVTLTSADGSKAYDGEALTAHEVSVGGDGWAEGEGGDYEWSGSQTVVGTSENGFTYTLKEGTKAGNYVLSTVFGTLEVTKGNQRIEFAEIGEQVATNVVELGAVASSGLVVSYSVEGPGVLEGNVLTFTGAGEVAVTASQAGDGNWEAAEDVTRSFPVAKAVAEVTLDGLAQRYDGEGKAVSVVTVPEGLTVLVTYDGGATLPVAVGSHSVVAMVVDDVWSGSASGVLEIGKGEQRIDFEEVGPQWMTNTVTLSATASSGLPVTFALVLGPGMLDGAVLTFTGPGRVVVEAVQEGNEIWEEVRVRHAVDVIREGIMTIDPETSIVSPLGGTGNVSVHAEDGARWVAEPMAEWLSVPVGEGVGDGVAEYLAEANPETEERSGQIRFFSPASLPENEGDSGRTIWFETNAVDLATGSRTISPSFPITFDGTFAKTLSGEAIPQLDENAFSVRIQLKGGVQFDVNQIMTVFGHSLYLNDERQLIFDGHVGNVSLDMGSVYWITLSQDQEKNVRVALIKEGGNNGTVEIRYKAEDYLHDFTVGTTALSDAFQLGYGAQPIARYLKNATIYGIEFWTRALTDIEATTQQGQDANCEGNPFGGLNSAIVAHFRLNQNGCYTVGVNGDLKPSTDGGVSITGWRATAGRMGLPQRALESEGEGRITISDVNNIFQGSYILNDGYPLNSSHYRHHDSGFYHWYPYPVTSTNQFDGTYNVWIYVNHLPSSPCSIFERLRVSGQETDAGGWDANDWYFKNESLRLSLLSTGRLLVSQNGVQNVVGSKQVEPECWNMVTFVGVERNSITIYVNGEELGNVPSEMSFGYFPPTDGYHYYSSSTGQKQMLGGIIPLVEAFTLGGWDGAIDELTLYDKALTSEQVAALYEGGQQRYFYHTVTQAMRGQAIDFPEIGEQWATNVVELGAVASPGLEVAYEVVSGPGVLDGNVLTFTGAGTVVVSASQVGDESWSAAETVEQSMVVQAVPTEVVLSGLEQVYDGAAKAVTVETVPEGVAVRVTYDGSEGVPVGAGRYAVVAESADGRFAGRAEGTLVVAKGSQGIEFGEIGAQVATNVVTLGAVASSGLEVSYSVEGPAVLDGATLAFTGAGTVTVTASQDGDGNWEAAEAVSVSFGVAKAVAEVTLGGLSQMYDGEAKEVEVSTVPEGLAVVVTYDGADAAPVEGGSYVVSAVVDDARWEGSASGTLVVTGGDQSIEFPAIGAQVATNAVVLEALASSGLEVSYSLEGPAVLDGASLAFTGAGTVTVTASQAGNANWKAAEPVSVSFEVAKAVAEVSLEGLSQTFDGGAHEVSAGTVPEGLSVVVTYDGEEEAPVEAGSYAVVATVEDAIWAGSAEGTLEVTAADIEEGEEGEFEVVLGANPKYDGGTQTVEVVSASWKGLPVTFKVEGNTAVDAGSYVLTVTGTGNFAGSRSVEWEVLRRTVTLTSADGSKAYDGEALTAHEVSVGGDGWAEGEGGDYEWSGSQTVVGKSENGFAYTLKEGTKAGNYVLSTVFGTLEVTKGSQSIDFAEIGAQAATNAVVLSAEASTGMEVKFAVLSGPGAVAGNVLTFTGAGTVTVMALQEGDANWAQATVLRSVAVSAVPVEVALSGLEQVYDGAAKAVTVETAPEGVAVRVTYDGSEAVPMGVGSYAVVAETADGRYAGRAEGTLVVSQGSQSIEFAEIGAQVATNVVALGAVASSGLDVSYAVEGPAVLEGSVLSFTGAGTVAVTASQAGNENWLAAEDVVRGFKVSKATAVVSLDGLSQLYDGEGKVVEVQTVPEGLSVAVTYDGEEEVPVGVGSYVVSAVVEDALFEGRAEGTLVVVKGAQSIEFAEIGAQVVTNVVELGAVASSGLEVGYAVEGAAVLEGSLLSFTGAGTVSVTASQGGDANWEAAADVVRTFEVGKATAAVTIGDLEQVYDGETHRVGVETVPEGLAVAVTYDGEAEEPVGVGRYAVVAEVVDEVWAGRAEGVLVVSKGTQSIEFAEIGSCGVAERLELRAEASSGLPVTFAVLSGPAILEDGGWLRFAETGTVSVVAMQFGDGNWEAAESVRQEFAVVKSGAVVTLAGLEQVFDGQPHRVEVTTEPAGLAVVVTYDGEEGEPVNAGSYVVVAEVADAKWAGRAEGVLVIAKGTQSIEFPEIGAQVLTNRVALRAVASSGLEVEYAVAEGPGVVEDGVLRFTGVGTVRVTASQGGDSNWEAAAPVTVSVEVTGALSLTVASAHGTAAPEVGEHEVLLGTVVEASVDGSPAELREGWRAVCTGWRLEGADGTALDGGEGMSARFEMAGNAVLTWLWETQALVRAEGLAHGTAQGGGWFAVGSTAVLQAVPEEGHPFTGWEVGGGKSLANPLSWTVRGPVLALATFYTTYYAGEDGDDGADGLSRRTAKREISAALAEAAWGDEVVAAAGTYGAIVVPEGVSVRSDEGAESTTIRGGAGTRCVEAEADVVVEGFALEGGEVDGDGGGALLADGAELWRCILRGNKAGGEGGGAKGGVLENCLVAGNEASAGGGVAGAVLRHCTVVENRGGGAKGGSAVNCVFWENEGGDAAGCAVSYSFSLPKAEGAGNVEGEKPGFAGEGNWRLAYESPCVDAGTETGATTDLDGAPRPQQKVYGEALKPDMGCYEYVPKARFVWEQGRGIPPYESWQDAARDIQSALDVSGSGDRVVVEAGTYGGFATSNAVVVLGLHGAGQTFVDGGNAERAVTMTGGGVLEGFTVRNGASEDCGGILADGGATVRDVVVEGCRATGAEGVGGGLCLYGGSVAENVTARENRAAYGAGVWATEASAVEGCELAGNAASAWGGGAWLEGESRMAGSVAAGNTAVREGGVYGEDCEIADCAVTDNAATGTGGGAAVERGTFRNNVLTGNKASTGGGLYAKNTDGHDCLVAGNEAAKGAGVWSEGDGQLWNFTVADNEGAGAGVALRGTALLGNSISWGNAGGNVDAAAGTEVRHSCTEPAAEGEGNFAENPRFVGGGDYHLRAGSPCVDAGENREWMHEACDFDGQRRVQPEGEGRDSWVDIGADEAALDAVGMPSREEPWWTWRVVMDARLQLQSTSNLLDGASWADDGAPFTATGQTWTLDEPFEGPGAKFYRLNWLKK